MKYYATTDYYDPNGWEEFDAATMEEAAELVMRRWDPEPGTRIWLAVRDREAPDHEKLWAAEIRGYEAYRPKVCKARVMLPPVE